MHCKNSEITKFVTHVTLTKQNQGWIVPESSLISLTDSISSIASGLRAPAPGCPSPVTGLKKC